MKRTSPSFIRAALQEIGLRPRKELGQNFLADANILELLVRLIQLPPGARVVEIGPGLGAITERLLAAGADVLAIEKDARLHAFLAAQFAAHPRLELRHLDALDLDAREAMAGGRDLLVSNLPYSVGSRILVDFLRADPPPRVIVVTVQKEVAERLAAAPGSRVYGTLSIWAQLGHDVTIRKTVSAGCFWPPPAVSSSIVELRRKDDAPSLRHREFFFELTKAAFQARRKQLGTILQRLPDSLRLAGRALPDLSASTGVSMELRPEDLGVEQWCRLSEALFSARQSGGG